MVLVVVVVSVVTVAEARFGDAGTRLLHVYLSGCHLKLRAGVWIGMPGLFSNQHLQAFACFLFVHLRTCVL